MLATAVQLLNPRVRGPQARNFERVLEDKIAGQAEAVRAVADLFQLYEAGLHPPGRPVGNLLFLGPTGSGKTRVVEAAAAILFGDAKALIKVDCAEFQHSHEIAKLVGSPPGYLGHRETHPLITQESLAKFHNDKIKLSFLLFDEIEKASDSLWQLLLGIMDKATLTLGDNRRVDLSQTIIFLTSNLGAAQMKDLSACGLGFAPPPQGAERFGAQMERTAVQAARRKFSPEFMNRLDKVVVFRPLGADQLERILDLELAQVQQRLLLAARGHIQLRLGTKAREFLLREGTDSRYGARHLKRAIERHLMCPLANLIASEQVEQGNRIAVEFDSRQGGLSFSRDPVKFHLPGVPHVARPAAASVALEAAEATAAAHKATPAAAPEGLCPKPHESPSPRARRRER